jgi:hypothetical protein
MEVAFTQIKEPLESKPWNMMLGSLNNQVKPFLISK